MANQTRSIRIDRVAVTRPVRKAAESALIYTVLCSAYIILSGIIAVKIAKTPEQLHKIETFKGIAFIIITGILFFFVSCLQMRKIRRQEEILLKEEATLLHAERRLVAAMSAGIAGHDLNNLLVSLSGLLQKLQSRCRTEPSLSIMCEQINNNVARLSRLADRLESGIGLASTDNKEMIDLKDAVHEIASIVRTHPDVKFCSISASDVDPVSLNLNRTLLEEALLNLLINAAQAAGTKGKIDLRLMKIPGSVLIEVHDNGPGVPDFLMKDIFEPCFTTKPGGTGIGLLAVTAFAESCNAEVSVGRSQLGGAVFRIKIPA